MPGDTDGARVGHEERRQDVHRRGLAGPVGTEQRKDRAPGYGKVDAVEDAVIPKAVDQAPDLDPKVLRRGHGSSRHGQPLGVVGGGSGAAQENVAVAGGRVDLDSVVRFARAVRALELAAHHPVPCLDVEPSGAAVRDTDLELAVRALGGDGPTAYGVQPDVPR